jgi:transposase InsO family protein
MGSTAAKKRARIGYDYVHSIVDDHSRYAYSEILDDEQAATCHGFFVRAVEHFAANGINRIREVMTDNHWSYTRSHALAATLERIEAKHVLIKPHCPWQNGKVERFNRTLQIEWAYRQVFTTNTERHDALAPWLEGSRATTIDDATAHSEESRQSPGCHQPDGRVQLDRAADPHSSLPDPDRLRRQGQPCETTFA